MNEILDRLNPAQYEAVTHMGGPLMIIAGAGTGKTRVITHRIAFLHRECGIPLNRIMAVTFTNKAAREMRQRVCALLKLHDSPMLPIGTFHSRCAMILRREAEAAGLHPAFAILDENDQRQAIRRVLKEMDIPEKRVRPAQVQSLINMAKMRLLEPEDCEEDFESENIPFVQIYKAYEALLKKSRALDFEDLLKRTVQLFASDEAARKRWADRYQYLLVDEYQDTNHVQFQLTRLLAKDHRQVCVVGDEDQSIYSWRGAEISNLLDFESAFEGARIVKLEQNYRSTSKILHAADGVITRNSQRIGKTLFTEIGEGESLRLMHSAKAEDEAAKIALECRELIDSRGVDPNEIAIFYRSHWLARVVEDGMRRASIPYRIVGGVRFYDRAEVKDLLCFLRLAVYPDDDLAFERVVNKPARGVGAKAQQTIAQTAAALGASLFNGSREALKRGAIKGKGAAGLAKFLDSVARWNSRVATASVHAMMEEILGDTNYLEDGIGDVDSIEAASREENIEELQTLLRGFEPEEAGNETASFLTSLALDAERTDDPTNSLVSLLTIHNAKGLEFDHVYCIGLEEGIFPTRRSEENHDVSAVEEERRLFYVAITRARRHLTLCYSERRSRPDFFHFTPPSIFLHEVPRDALRDADRERLEAILLPGGGGAGVNRGYPRPGTGPDRRPFGWRQGRPAPSSPRIKGPMRDIGVGTRVEHRWMGPGTVTELSGHRGKERVFIEFDDGRSQDFILRYAPLTVIG